MLDAQILQHENGRTSEIFERSRMDLETAELMNSKGYDIKMAGVNLIFFQLQLKPTMDLQKKNWSTLMYSVCVHEHSSPCKRTKTKNTINVKLPKNFDMIIYVFGFASFLFSLKLNYVNTLRVLQRNNPPPVPPLVRSHFKRRKKCNYFSISTTKHCLEVITVSRCLYTLRYRQIHRSDREYQKQHKSKGV